MPSATYVLEVNWNGDGSTWTAETDRIISVAWSLGRDYASQLTGRSIAGKLTAVLRNPDGRYASFNTSSPLTGNIVPLRKVRWRTTAPSAQTLWAGFLSDIKPGRVRGDAATAVLVAFGPLYWIGDRDVNVAVSTSIGSGTAVEKVLDDAGWPAADRALDAGQITVTRWEADRVKAMTALRDLEDTEWGFIRETRDGKIAWEDIHHRLKTPHTASQATFSDAAGAALPYDEIEQLDSSREIFNRFDAAVQLFEVQALATLWTLAGEVPSIDPGASRVFWAKYPTPDAPTQADHVDAWTTPVAATDYVANSASDGSGTNLTASVAVSVSKFARSMKITLTNNATVVAYITTLQARGTPVYKRDPVGVFAEDTTSQTKYGKRTYPLPGKWYPTTFKAQSYVEYAVSRYKDPLPVIRVGFRADLSDDHLTQALTRTVSERVTLVANGTPESGAQLGINRDFFIERESHVYTLKEHRTRYDLSDATGQEYWTLGVSLLGMGTRLAP